MRKSLIVLGMHRSGTSAMAGCLQRMGVTIGSRFLADLYEQADLVDANDALLHDLGSCWDDQFALPDAWWRLPSVEAHRTNITTIIEREFGRHAIWAIKDPRICLLLPLWIDILKSMSIEPYFLISIRNPFEIARSLLKRDRFCQSKSLVLWMKYFLSAEYCTRSYKRFFYNFDELVANPVDTIRNMFIQLGINPPLDWVQAGNGIGNFIKRGLKHHNAASAFDGQAVLPPQFNELYRLLFSGGEKTTGSGLNPCALDNLREQFELRQNFYLNRSLRDSCLNFRENEKKMLTICNEIVDQYVHNKQIDQAAELLSKLTAVFPDYPSVWNNHGMAHELKEDYSTAVSSFQRAIDLSPGYQLARNNLRRVGKKLSDVG